MLQLQIVMRVKAHRNAWLEISIYQISYPVEVVHPHLAEAVYHIKSSRIRQLIIDKIDQLQYFPIGIAHDRHRLDEKLISFFQHSLCQRDHIEAVFFMKCDTQAIDTGPIIWL